MNSVFGFLCYGNFWGFLSFFVVCLFAKSLSDIDHYQQKIFVEMYEEEVKILLRISHSL